MPPKLVRHLTYANVAATAALVIAISGGGVAMAAGLAHNSVGSPQIKNNSVKSVDIKNSSVKSADIKNHTIAEADLAPNSVGGAAVAPDSLTGADIKESTIGKVPKASVADRASNILQAVVSSSGELESTGAGATSVTRLSAGAYEVLFDRDVTACSYLISEGSHGTGLSGARMLEAVHRVNNKTGVFATSRDATGSVADAAFFLTLIC